MAEICGGTALTCEDPGHMSPPVHVGTPPAVSALETLAQAILDGRVSLVEWPHHEHGPSQVAIVVAPKPADG